MSKLVERTAFALEKSGLSASRASEAAGLGRRFITDLLDGSKRSVTTENIEKLAVVLRCSPEWLAFGVVNTDSIAANISNAEQRDAWLKMGMSLVDKSNVDLKRRSKNEP